MSVVDSWFRTDPEPALLGSRCAECTSVFFPPVAADSFCRNPVCDGSSFSEVPLSRQGLVWSYTDAQYQPPAPYLATTDPFEPFALAAVVLPEGLTVLGQVATGYGVDDLEVGTAVEVVIEPLDGDLQIWRWKPVVELGAESVP
jgi:uncharacterized protein